MNTKLLSLIIFLFLLSATTLAIAQTGGDFDLSWFTINGGGGTSSGGDFALTGTIGQADAGPLSGGNFDLNGGFIQCATAAPNTPQINLTGNNIQLDWSGSAANIYRATNNPYFTPNTPYASNAATNWTDSGAAGNPATNYTYIIRATGTCGESGNSLRLGEFAFSLNPGN